MSERKTVSQCVSSDYCKGWNDAVDAMPKWISVEERLPEDCSDVLIVVNGYIHVGFYNLRFRHWVNYSYSENNVTHWMHLPCAPKEEA